MIIHTGHTCRIERTRLGLPLRSLAELTGISVSQLSAFELGAAARLSEPLRDRIGEVLSNVDELRVALLPAKIDMSDAAALREALTAHARGLAPWLNEGLQKSRMVQRVVVTA